MKRIDISTKKYPNTFTLVDDADFEWLNQWKWYASKTHYGGFAAVRGATRINKRAYMHRIIMNTPKDLQIDHKNHDTLDNRKQNLRICTGSQNQHNQNCHKTRGISQYKGVTWSKKSKKWKAQIRLDSKQYNLGGFENETEAAKTYDNKAKELFGEFARCNKIL